MGGGGPTPPQQATPIPETEPYISAAANWLKGQVGTSMAPWPGPFAVGETPEQAVGAGSAINLADIITSSGLNPQAITALQSFIGAGPGQAPFISSITDALTKLNAIQQQRDVAGIQARYGALGGAMSSPAATAVSDYLAQSGAGLEQNIGQVELQGAGLQQSAINEALGLTPSLAQLIFGMGTTQQQEEDVGLQRAITEYQRVQMSPYIPLNYFTGALPGGSGLPEYTPSPVPGLVTGLTDLLTPASTG